MNYKIVVDYQKFNKFLEFLPELNDDEVYYVSLFARRKYDKSAQHDKANLKRFTATSKEWLKLKMLQLEVPVGGYVNRNMTFVTQAALACYIAINPRSLKRAQKMAAKKMVDAALENENYLNPQAIGMTAVHKSKSRTQNVTFDFDVEKKKPILKSIGSIVGYNFHYIVTRGGFHALIDPLSASENNNRWYTEIQRLGCDTSGDMLSPIPGTLVAGDFIPKLKQYKGTV